MDERVPSPAAAPRGRLVPVLLAAGSAAWEAHAVAQLSDVSQGVHLVQRCLDLADLVGAAVTGTAEVAVLADETGGLDADTVARLHRSGLRVVVVADPRGTASRRLTKEALQRLEVDLVLGPDDLPVLAARVRELARATGSAATGASAAGSAATGSSAAGSSAAGSSATASSDLPVWFTGPHEDDPAGREAPDGEPVRRTGRLLAVWGPKGAPGRTSTAIGLAAEAAHRGRPTLLVDADAYGGGVAQHLAVRDEVSGLLGAARLANSGQLDVERLASLARSLGAGLRVLTGLPRPGRWTEVRPTAFEEVLAVARRLDDLVVVDTGPGVEAGIDDPFDTTPNRDDTARTVLAEADAVVVVASADPVGLQRAARALTELTDLRPAGADVVVVNRMRSTLGWHERDVAGLLHQVAPLARLRFLPDDPRAADRALVSGRTLVESGDTGLRRAVAELATEVLAVLGLPDPVAGRPVGGRVGRIGRLGRTG